MMNNDKILYDKQIELYVKQMFQKGDKEGMTSTKMYAFLEQNIVAEAFLWLHKLAHKLTFGIIYFLKI